MDPGIQADTSDLWMKYMQDGRFEQAWQYSDVVLKSRAGTPCWHLPRHFQYIWDGSSLKQKRVLIRCYHGLGDTIQFIRYAPLVKTVAQEVIVWVQPRLIPLLRTVQGIDHLLPLHDGKPDVAFDVDVEIMELPHIFRTTVATIPLDIPYLKVSPVSLPNSKEIFSVGLVWKAGDWDQGRNIPFTLLQPLSLVKGIQFYIIQADALSAGWQKGFGVNPGNDDLDADARLIAALNLVISIDSMPVHLAGALGIPVWNLLQAKADWRWMRNREDSPWYPSMRIFRQEHQGEWEPVIERVIVELQKEVQKFRNEKL